MIEIPCIPGLIPSPDDARDIPLGAVVPSFGTATLPDAYEVEGFRGLPVDNQRQVASCVANSCTKVKEWQEWRELGMRLDFSVRFCYAMAKKIDGYTGYGTFLRAGVKVLEQYGACTTEVILDDFSLLDETFRDWTKIPAYAFDLARPYRVQGYARVTVSSIEDIKQAVHTAGPTLIGVTLSNEGWRQERVRPPKIGEPTYGHAIICFGWEEDDLICRNSWSEAWGNGGNLLLGKNYEPFLFGEAWTFVDMPTELITNAKRMHETVKVEGRPEIFALLGGEKFWIAPERAYTFGIEKKLFLPFREITAEEFALIPEGGLFTKF